ncbi:hypothetical protein D3C77_341570 [compost metagenome]
MDSAAIRHHGDFYFKQIGSPESDASEAQVPFELFAVLQAKKASNFECRTA